MKIQISKQHTDSIDVQLPTTLNPTFSLGLLSRAFVMLLLIAAIVVPGAAQGIYVASNPEPYGKAYIGEYKLNGTPVNTSLFKLPGSSYVADGFAVFGSNLLVPIGQNYLLNGMVSEFNAITGMNNSSFPSLTLPLPRAAVVSGGHLFVLYLGTIGEYDATSGYPINATVTTVPNLARSVAASPGPGGTVNLFVTDEGGSPNIGSIQKITVNPSTGTVTSSSTLVSGLNSPQGIAVSEDGHYVYVVIPYSNSYSSTGEIDEYDATTGSPVHVPLRANISGIPWDLAVSGSNLLVTLGGSNAIGEYNVSTGTWNPSLVTGLYLPTGIAVPPGGGTTFCSPPPSNMVAWYSFDQNLIGGTQYDLAKGNDATTYGPQSISGEVSNALLFDGIDDHVVAPHQPWLNMSTFNLSIDAWVKIANPADYNGVVVLVDKRQSSPLRGYSFFLYNGRLGLQLADSTSAAWMYSNYLSTTKVPADNQWHMVAVTVRRNYYQGGVWYLDGAPVDSPFNPSGHMGSLNSSAPLEIGVREASLGGGGFFKGGSTNLRSSTKS
jgi:Concanavalin A-like lectin/glucanases superfamily